MKKRTILVENVKTHKSLSHGHLDINGQRNPRHEKKNSLLCKTQWLQAQKEGSFKSKS